MLSGTLNTTHSLVPGGLVVVVVVVLMVAVAAVVIEAEAVTAVTADKVDLSKITKN